MPSSVLETATEYDATGAIVPSPTLTWTIANTAIATCTTPGSTSVITAQSVGNTTFHVADTSRGVVSPDYTIKVISSLGMVVLPGGVTLGGTLPALAGGGSGLPILGVRYRMLVDAFLGSSITAGGLVLISGGSGTSLEASVSVATGTLTFAGTFNNGTANSVVGTVAQSALPVAGTGVVLYVLYDAASGGTGTIALLTDSGTVLWGNTIAGGSGDTPTGNTTITIGGGSSGPGGGMTLDGVEILTALVSTPNTPPLPADAGAIGLWGFAGVLTPTGGLGPTLAPAGGSVTYLSGGIWS